MICISTPSPKPHLPISRNLQRPNPHRLALSRRPIHSFLPNSEEKPTRTSTHILKPLKEASGGAGARSHVEGKERMWLLCGIGYWVQGFRCFPWLALNFHMAHGMRFGPSTLQLVQNVGNLPMVAKPLYGVLSDALYIGRAHRLPYISFGAILQVLSWGTLSLIPLTGDTFPTQMFCILLGNLGASFTEVVSDALVAEFSKTQKSGVLQSYAYMALAAGGILGNLSGGFFLLKSQQPKAMFLSFTLLLALQLALSLTTREDALCSSHDLGRQSAWSSITENLSKQLSNMVAVISDKRILYPLSWIIASITAVPLLSGTMFCFQTQCLNLDPSIIGLSKVVGQLFFLSATYVYNQYLKRLPMRTLIFGVQVLYALCLLSDLLLVKQINLQLGISNEAFVLCISALAEATAQFKILPFTVFLAKLCPSGCEGSLFAFFASALCLSSIFSGISGVGLANLLGLSTGSYAQLPLAIVLQSVAALVPLGFITHVPMLQTVEKSARRSWKKMNLSRSKWGSI